jgi:hypothetical protein
MDCSHDAAIAPDHVVIAPDVFEPGLDQLLKVSDDFISGPKVDAVVDRDEIATLNYRVHFILVGCDLSIIVGKLEWGVKGDTGLP